MLKCLIVDDERPAREEILYILKEIGKVEVVGEASHGVEALELIEKLKPDVVFLDIQMPQMSGIEVAKRIVDQGYDLMIIFVTAYDQFAIEAFEVNAIDYLLKPISEDRLKKTIQKIISHKSEREDLSYDKLSRLIEDIRPTKASSPWISVYYNNKLIPIEIKDIIYATIEDKNTVIITEKGKYGTNYTLNDLMEKLDPQIFFRSHKSYIINLKYIESIEPWFHSTYNINLKSVKDTIPVSRSCSKKFREIMNIE
ncbi:MAG: response regulator transcription factor [Tissierellia bacterium]|nr:response regulator transcription factor [Tissierellia bacterium]